MAFTKNKTIDRILIVNTNETIEITWKVVLLEDDVEVADRYVSKWYNSANSIDLDTDVSAGLANKLKNIFGWA